jgi:predicted DNA-binding transcriptional regulator AlpA
LILLIAHIDSAQVGLERAGKFPHRIKVGDRRVGWLESELERWRKARAAQRGALTVS